MTDRVEQKYKAKNGVEVIYKHKSRKYDFNHLIIVFSGFLNANPGNYDFNNALDDCPADVIWISDNFENMYTYYLCIGMDFKVEEAVTEFIHYKLSELKLNYDNVTITGYSKGGSAALYYGLKLPVANIVTTVPQIKIGSYVSQNWSHVAKHMMGENVTKAAKDYLDKLIIKQLKKVTDFDKNIYLLTSESDVQYKPEIEPILDDLKKYSNFNLIKTYSVFCREHNQITSHHTAILLGIYYCLASEATPIFKNNEVNFFGSQPKPLVKPSKDPETFVDARVLNIKNHRLFIDGIAFFRGYNFAEYEDVDYKLILKGKSLITKPLAKIHRPYLTKEFFDGKNFIIYDKACFTTYQHKGIDMSDIPNDRYELFIQISSHGIAKEVRLKTSKDLNKEDVEYNILADSSRIILNLKR